MFVGSTLKEREEGGSYASLDLGCELTSSFVLFCFHEASGEGNFDWCSRFRKDKCSCDFVVLDFL